MQYLNIKQWDRNTVTFTFCTFSGKRFQISTALSGGLSSKLLWCVHTIAGVPIKCAILNINSQCVSGLGEPAQNTFLFLEAVTVTDKKLFQLEVPRPLHQNPVSSQRNLRRLKGERHGLSMVSHCIFSQMLSQGRCHRLNLKKKVEIS